MKVFNIKIKVVGGLFFSALTVYLLLALIGMYSLDAKLIVGFVVFFLLTFFVLKNSNFPNKLFAFILVAWLPFLVLVCFNVFQFKDTWTTLWSSIFICLGVLAGVLYYIGKNILIPIVFGLFIPLWFIVIKEPYKNKMQYGYFDQTTFFNFPINVSFFDTGNASQNFYDPTKYYILDFWHSRCGVCFRKFPVVDSISRLADTAKFFIGAVNIPILNEVKEDNYHILDSFEYKFQKLFAINRSVADSFGVVYYPTTIVIKSNHIIFRGDFDEAIKRFKVVE